MSTAHTRLLLRDLKSLLAGLTALAAAYSPVAAQDVSAEAERVVIAGTPLSMVPPLGFAPSERFRGFESLEYPGASVMVVAMPAPFAEATAGFDESRLGAQGMELLSRRPDTVGAVEGLRLEVAQEAQGMRFRKTILAFGDSAQTTLVNATWLADDDDALALPMATALASLRIDEDALADPRGALDFTVDETAGNLREAAVMGTSLLLNRHGRIAPDLPDQTAVLVDRSYSAPVIEDAELFVQLRLRQLPGTWEIAPGEKVLPVTYGGLDGYQLRAINTDAENEAATVAVVLEPGGGYFVLMGMYAPGDAMGKADAEEVLGTFRVR